MQFGEAVALVLDRASATTKEAAIAAGMSPRSVQQWIQGRAPRTTAPLVKMCEGLDRPELAPMLVQAWAAAKGAA